MGLTRHHHLSKHSVDTVFPWPVHFLLLANAAPVLLGHNPYEEGRATPGQPGAFLEGHGWLQERAFAFEEQQLRD